MRKKGGTTGIQVYLLWLLFDEVDWDAVTGVALACGVLLFVVVGGGNKLVATGD